MKNFDDWANELADKISNSNEKNVAGTIHNLDDGGSVVAATVVDGNVTEITLSSPITSIVNEPWTWVRGEQIDATKNDLVKLLKPALRNYFELYHDSMIDELTEVVVSSIDSEFKFTKKQ